MLIFKIAISVATVGLVATHLAYPNLSVDTITLGLLIFALLPWASSFIVSAKFPGGWKIKFQELKQASNKIEAATSAQDEAAASIPPATVQSSPATTLTPKSPHPPTHEATSRDQRGYIETIGSIANIDPNLALVAIRIEIEKRLRALADKHDLDDNQPVNRLLTQLSNEAILSPSVVNALQEIVSAGNNAAHGATVEPSVHDWATGSGLNVIRYLDKVLAKGIRWNPGGT